MSMSWVSDVLKHLDLSKVFTGALFVTTVVMLVGPAIQPTVFDPVPDKWRWLVTGLCLFSGCYLVCWFIPRFVRSLTSLLQNIATHPHIRPLNRDEEFLLRVLAVNRPSDRFNLNELNMAGTKKLELLEASSLLERRGLLRVNRFDNDTIELTKRGRACSLKIARSERET